MMFHLGHLNDHLFGKESLFDLLCVSFVNVYQFVFASLPFSFEGGMWDLIVLVVGHCFSFYFE